MVANEILDFVTITKKSCMMFKIYFEKAYDTVSWNFLRLIMKKTGFGIQWMHWMEASVFSSHMSFLVNDNPTMDFDAERGLRQGDPLSPFLFVLVTEALVGLIQRDVDIGTFSGFQVNDNTSVEVL